MQAPFCTVAGNPGSKKTSCIGDSGGPLFKKGTSADKDMQARRGQRMLAFRSGTPQCQLCSADR